MDGYQKAVSRDIMLAEGILGPFDGEKARLKLRGFLYTCVSVEDVTQYEVTWCGRFSIPFGLELLRRLAAKTGQPVPTGRLLRYGTSLSEPELPVSDASRDAGLGYTAPSNLHHWVGYAAIGYSTF